MTLLIAIIIAYLIYRTKITTNETSRRTEIVRHVIDRLSLCNSAADFLVDELYDDVEYLRLLLMKRDISLEVSRGGQLVVTGVANVKTTGNVSRVVRDKDTITMIVLENDVVISTKSTTSRTASEVTIATNDLLTCLHQQKLIRRAT